MTSTTELDSMEDDGGVMGEYYGEDREYSEEEGELFGEGGGSMIELRFGAAKLQYQGLL